MLGASLLLAACGSIQTYRWPLAAPEPPTPGRPQVFFEGTLPATGIREIALVEAVGNGNRANNGDVIAALQDEAALFGASAIVRVRVDCGYGQCHGYGVAIRYVGAPQVGAR